MLDEETIEVIVAGNPYLLDEEIQDLQDRNLNIFSVMCITNTTPEQRKALLHHCIVGGRKYIPFVPDEQLVDYHMMGECWLIDANRLFHAVQEDVEFDHFMQGIREKIAEFEIIVNALNEDDRNRNYARDIDRFKQSMTKKQTD